MRLHLRSTARGGSMVQVTHLLPPLMERPKTTSESPVGNRMAEGEASRLSHP